MIVVVMILVIKLVTSFELVKTYKNNTEEVIKQFGKLLQLQMSVSFNDEFTNDRNSSDNDSFDYWMIVDERICMLETVMKDIKGQISSTYGVIVEQDNVKTRSACQKLVLQNADEECVQCSEDARREERMQQVCGQPTGKYSGGRFFFFNLVRVESFLSLEVGSWNSIVSSYFYGSSFLEVVYRVVIVNQAVLSRLNKVSLRKEYKFDQINRMLFYWVQFVIYGESNRNELNDSKVSSLYQMKMNSTMGVSNTKSVWRSQSVGYQMKMNASTMGVSNTKSVWWSQSVSHYKVSKYGLKYSR